jgi:acetyltransferase-like isoleucine patch superfamily enzyme
MALADRAGRLRATAHLAARPRVRGGAGAVFLHGTPVFAGAGEIVIGRALRAEARPVRPTLGARAGGRLTIGDHVFVNSGASVYAHQQVTLGSHVLLGDHAAVWDTDFHALEEGAEPRVAPVSIGDAVWIGRQAIVLPGVTIGGGAVVAAGAIVTRDVAPATLVAGNPARPVRELRAPPGWVRR